MNGDNNQTLDPLDDLINSLGGPANADPDNSGDDGDGNGTAAGNEPAATTEPAGNGAQEPGTEPTGDPDGDNNGDGVIDILDLLKIQKHLLGVNKLKNAYLNASDINKDGVIDIIIDLLKMRKHILNVNKIEQ